MSERQPYDQPDTVYERTLRDYACRDPIDGSSSPTAVWAVSEINTLRADLAAAQSRVDELERLLEERQPVIDSSAVETCNLLGRSKE